jgi:hypothetical protein
MTFSQMKDYLDRQGKGHMVTTFTDEEQEEALQNVVDDDVEGLMVARQSYGDSWKKRGGIGAFMMLARKWDRLEQLLTRSNGLNQYDVFQHVIWDSQNGGEGTIDAIRDLRRYLALVEAELVLRGINLPVARDNQGAERKTIRLEMTDAEAKELVRDVMEAKARSADRMVPRYEDKCDKHDFDIPERLSAQPGEENPYDKTGQVHPFGFEVENDTPPNNPS